MLESVRVAQNHRFSGIDPTTRRTHLIRGCPASTCLPVWHSSVLLSPGLFARRRAEPGGRKRIAHGASRGKQVAASASPGTGRKSACGGTFLRPIPGLPNVPRRPPTAYAVAYHLSPFGLWSASSSDLAAANDSARPLPLPAHPYQHQVAHHVRHHAPHGTVEKQERKPDRRYQQARLRARFRTRGKGRPIIESTSATGFRRRGASSPGDFAPRRQFGGVSIHGKEVIRFDLGIICQDLLLGCPTGEPLQNLLNGDPVTANARLPKPHVRIDRDPFKE